MRWGLIIQDLLCEKRDYKLDYGFNREPVKRKEYGRNMSSLEFSLDEAPNFIFEF